DLQKQAAFLSVAVHPGRYGHSPGHPLSAAWPVTGLLAAAASCPAAFAPDHRCLCGGVGGGEAQLLPALEKGNNNMNNNEHPPEMAGALNGYATCSDRLRGRFAYLARNFRSSEKCPHIASNA